MIEFGFPALSKINQKILGKITFDVALKRNKVTRPGGYISKCSNNFFSFPAKWMALTINYYVNCMEFLQ
jgi:hypothetical protein